MPSDTGTTKNSDGRKDRKEEEAAAAASDVTTDAPHRHTTAERPDSTAGTQPHSHYDQHVTPNIRDFQSQQRRPGDFDRDLMPGSGGVDDPAGNLMGPNHPAFGGPAIGSGGGYGMRPRFDPYGPPGGPTDPRNLDPNRNIGPNDPRNPQLPRQPRPPPGGPGEPNPDHERPPNDLNNNMFM